MKRSVKDTPRIQGDTTLLTAAHAVPHFNHLATKAMNAGVLAIDARGIIRIFNPAARQILNISRQEKILGRDLSSIIPESRLKEILSSKKTKIRQIPKESAKFIAIQSPIEDQNTICGAVSIFFQLSQLKELTGEIELFKSLAKELTAIFENSYDGIYITDGKGKTLRVNDAYERITGLQASSLIGKNMREIVNTGLISESVTFKIQKAREPMTITQKINGGKEILVSGVPVFDENNELYRVVSSVRDMTELNNFRRQLAHTKELASRYEHELDELRASQVEHTNFISNSKQMTEVLELAMRVAKVDSTVLIQGDSGVGKEIVANLIHKYSYRARKGSFIKINCCAIPNELLESELFGYEPGAFTGAKKTGKPGIFELSDNGTLFLDEIGSISEALQVKLLRAIQFKEITRLGATKTKKINIRIVAATSRNLKDLVTSGKFRKDLFYRLHVVPINIPPLKERRDDIIPFVVFYLDQFNREFGLTKRFSKEALEQLNAYHWPGNVRELKNMVERLVVTTLGDIITCNDLPSSVGNEHHLNRLFINADEDYSLTQIVGMVEKERILQAFARHKSTRKVAAALKISQSAVMRKVKKYDLKFNRSWAD